MTAAKYLYVETVINLITVTNANGLYVTFVMRSRAIVVLEEVDIVKCVIHFIVVIARLSHFAKYVKERTVQNVCKFGFVNFVRCQNVQTAKQWLVVLYATLLHV